MFSEVGSTEVTHTSFFSWLFKTMKSSLLGHSLGPMGCGRAFLQFIFLSEFTSMFNRDMGKDLGWSQREAKETQIAK